jgi:hypothetical protein
LSGLPITEMILLQDGAGCLDRGPGEDSGFEIIPECCGIAVFAPRVAVKLQNQRNKEG